MFTQTPCKMNYANDLELFKSYSLKGNIFNPNKINNSNNWNNRLLYRLNKYYEMDSEKNFFKKHTK